MCRYVTLQGSPWPSVLHHWNMLYGLSVDDRCTSGSSLSWASCSWWMQSYCPRALLVCLADTTWPFWNMVFVGYLVSCHANITWRNGVQVDSAGAWGLPWGGTLSVFLHIILDVQGVGNGFDDIVTVSHTWGSIGVDVVTMLWGIALWGDKAEE